jgi:transcription antitermination factor NusG
MFLQRCPIEVVYEGYRWYVLRVEGAYEKKASLILHLYGTVGVIPHYELVRRLWVPEISLKSLSKDGVVKERRASMVPGYLFIETILSYQLYATLRRPDLPHVFGWLQSWKSWPSMITQSDIQRLAVLENREPEPLNLSWGVGDEVILPWLGVQGEVSSISGSSVMLDIEIFHRRLPFKVGREFLSEIVKAG